MLSVKLQASRRLRSPFLHKEIAADEHSVQSVIIWSYPAWTGTRRIDKVNTILHVLASNGLQHIVSAHALSRTNNNAWHAPISLRGCKYHSAIIWSSPARTPTSKIDKVNVECRSFNGLQQHTPTICQSASALSHTNNNAWHASRLSSRLQLSLCYNLVVSCTNIRCIEIDKVKTILCVEVITGYNNTHRQYVWVRAHFRAQITTLGMLPYRRGH